MADSPTDAPRLNWQFSSTFWAANAAELYERAAYYGMAIALVLYLTERVGFSDVTAGYVAGAFTSILYLLPPFAGIMADKIGFKRALLVAFGLLTAGYALLGAFQYKPSVVAALALIMVGGAIVKPVISGTVAKCSDEQHRARAFSIFYAMVNIGAFGGKAVAAVLRIELGLDSINYYAAAMAAVAFLIVAFLYRAPDRAGEGKSLREAAEGLVRVLGNVRFLCLILIVAGFWAIQHQLYACLPKYVLRLLGESAKPEWLANISTAVVVVLVVPITHLLRNVKPINAIGVALLLMPFSALAIALSPAIEAAAGPMVRCGFVMLHPVTTAVILGIALQGVAECFLSPKYLEFASKQAPPGEIGLYMGYMHLSSVFAYLFGFVAAGYMLDSYCPDPTTLPPRAYEQWQAATDAGYRFSFDRPVLDDLRPGESVPDDVREQFQKGKVSLPAEAGVQRGDDGAWRIESQTGVYGLTAEGGRVRVEKIRQPLPAQYALAHRIWYVFAAVGAAAFGALLVFKAVTGYLDRGRRESGEANASGG